MGMGDERDSYFDGWLERSLRRELSRWSGVAAPEREWVTVARRRRRRLALVSGAGGALGAKAATGLVVAAFATVAATGTAVTGTANPVVWGEALESAASNLPDRTETSPPAVAPEEKLSVPAPVYGGPAAASTPSPAATPAPKHATHPHAPAPKRHGHNSSD